MGALFNFSLLLREMETLVKATEKPEVFAAAAHLTYTFAKCKTHLLYIC